MNEGPKNDYENDTVKGWATWPGGFETGAFSPRQGGTLTQISRLCSASIPPAPITKPG